MNGTSNYIISRMDSEGADYQAVLGDAQRLGLAEADPTMTLMEPMRPRNSLSWPIWLWARVHWSEIPRRGIDSIAKSDMEFASTLATGLKLIALQNLSIQEFN